MNSRTAISCISASPSFVSSASLLRVRPVSPSRSLMKLLNSIDPTIDPWGMSLVTDLQLDFTMLIANPMSPAAQPAPKCTSLTTCLAHTLSNLSIRMFWEMVLKVFLRSRYTSSSALPSFSKAGISSWKVTRLVKRDFPFIIHTDYSHSLSRVIHNISVFWNGFHVFLLLPRVWYEANWSPSPHCKSHSKTQYKSHWYSTKPNNTVSWEKRGMTWRFFHFTFPLFAHYRLTHMFFLYCFLQLFHCYRSANR